ncbi:MAG: hypothetical protein COB02_00265 [Candidatus Cloacimonadota bacterium]|nr:MAG: hypothetical protein COB02_00265 [Candidatus Cloacimonadota bacterium]
MKKLAVFGVDCLGLDLINRIPECFSFLISLQKSGFLKQIRSCDPPITIPAWSVMTTGRDPGELGVYGFSQRNSWDYFDESLPSSKNIKFPRIWDKLAKKNLKSCILSIPQTYPVKKIEGVILSSILTPSDGENKLFPPEFNIEKDHIFDVDSYRSNDKKEIFQQIEKMLEQKNSLILRELENKKDFFFAVIIGSDRLNHAFYQYIAKEHKNYTINNDYLNLFKSYYKKLDKYLENWFLKSKEKGFEPLLISDHGVRPLKGLFPLNDWLIEKGYLFLNNKVSGDIKKEDIDWAKTKIYSKGGYCGRLFINKKYREPLGIVENIDSLHKNLLNSILQEKKLELNLVKTDDIYQRKAGFAPDYLLYVNDLDYRCSSKIYGDTKLRIENDTGPDGANHDFHGIIAGNFPDFPNKIQDMFNFILDFYS